MPQPIWVLLLTMSIPPQFNHLLMATSSIIMSQSKSGLKPVLWTWQWVQLLDFKVTGSEYRRTPLAYATMEVEGAWKYTGKISKKQREEEASCGIHAIKNWGWYCIKCLFRLLLKLFIVILKKYKLQVGKYLYCTGLTETKIPWRSKWTNVAKWRWLLYTEE